MAVSIAPSRPLAAQRLFLCMTVMILKAGLMRGAQAELQQSSKVYSKFVAKDSAKHLYLA